MLRREAAIRCRLWAVRFAKPTTRSLSPGQEPSAHHAGRRRSRGSGGPTPPLGTIIAGQAAKVTLHGLGDGGQRSGTADTAVARRTTGARSTTATNLDDGDESHESGP